MLIKIKTCLYLCIFCVETVEGLDSVMAYSHRVSMGLGQGTTMREMAYYLLA